MHSSNMLCETRSIFELLATPRYCTRDVTRLEIRHRCEVRVFREARMQGKRLEKRLKSANCEVMEWPLGLIVG